jgi:hypothetical protein
VTDNFCIPCRGLNIIAHADILTMHKVMKRIARCTEKRHQMSYLLPKELTFFPKYFSAEG